MIGLKTAIKTLKTMKTCRHLPAHPGFSLVEVTLSVAIAALALITLLGLLPQGLEMSRKTSELTNNSNILEQIIRDLENAQYSTLPATKVRRYFNDQGSEVQQGDANITFVAEIDPEQPAFLPRQDAQAQAAYANQFNNNRGNLRRVIIRVATTTSPDFQFGENNRVSYSIFNHLIAKTR
ncbi:MAG TPA: hypothetical protein DDZ88_20890 [Verrucomicrobiales bacterium]|nr:hypothetical protein [Verrucomicrobiales bacterium]